MKKERDHEAVRIEKCVLHHGEQAIPLISGEFHYWRTPRENWGRIADKIREMDIEVVASYVPWNYHEISQEEYDFTGKTSPQRDLAGFIKILKEAGLYLIIRPGPYIYAEWPGGGPPERAVKHTFLSPKFKKMAGHYIREVCKILVPEQITKGGNIVMVQADNEPYPHVEISGEELGCFGGGGIFKSWLKNRYNDDIKELNKKWETSFKSFDEANFYFHEDCVNTDLPMADRLLPSAPYRTRYSDGADFIGWYAAKVVSTTAGWMREAGVDVPICANHWSSLYANFDYFCKDVEIAGTDQYPVAFMEGAHPSGIKDNWLYNMDILKMAEADVSNGNVWSSELQSGCSMFSGYLPVNHFKYVALSLMARGLRGWNWYMLVNRDNWSKAPINEWGRENSYFQSHKQAVTAARFVEPWKLSPLNDLSLFVYKPHRIISPGNFEATCRMLEQADISYDYFNPQSGQSPKTKVLLYSGDDWLDRETSRKLDRFVRAGGLFVTFSRTPSTDERGKPFKSLPLASPEGARPALLPLRVSYRGRSVEITKAGHMGQKVNLCHFSKVKGEPMMATLSLAAKETLVDLNAAKTTSFCMGYATRHGKGKVVHIGSNPSPELLKMVLEAEGLGQFSQADTPNVSTAAHRHDDGGLVLFVSNRGESQVAARIRLNTERLKLKIGAEHVIQDAISKDKTVTTLSDNLDVRLDGHDAKVLKLHPAPRQ